MFSKISTLWQMIAAITASILFHYQIQEKVARYSEDYAPIVRVAFSALILVTLFVVVYESIFFVLKKCFPRHSQILPRRSFLQSNQPIYKIEEGKEVKEAETIRLKRDTNAKLLNLCESLSQILVDYSAVIRQPEVKIKELMHAISEFKRGTLKIYFFGTQSTGKSSLVNTLVGRELSPVGPDKCTSCLVRIKGSSRVHASAEYEDGTVLDIDMKYIEKKIREWAEVENRPKELVIETNKPILGQPKIELIDSPGTGSARNEVVNRNIESEIVDEAIKSVAIAVIVYLPSGAQMQSHTKLLQSFKNNNISTVGVCNLDSNWASLYGRDKKEAERIIREAEANIQEKTKAECFRITLAEDIEEIGARTVETARIAGANSVQEVKDYLVKSLESREVHLARQTLGKSKSIATELLLDVELYLERNREYVEKFHSQRAALLNKITELKKVVGQNSDTKSSIGFVSGGAIGLLTGLFAFAILPYSAPLLTIATAIGGPTAIGTGIGAVVDGSKDNRKKKEYDTKLSRTYSELQEIIESSDLVLSSFGQREQISRLSSAEASSVSVLEKLYKDVDESLGNNERYNTYSTYQSAKKELITIQSRFVQFETMNFSRVSR